MTVNGHPGQWAQPSDIALSERDDAGLVGNSGFRVATLKQ